jgi:hypothetical protein
MKNFWQTKICLAILAIACCAATIAAQRKPVASTKTVEGVLYAVGGGQRIVSFLLHTPTGVLTFVASDKATRYVNFKNADTAWKLGARWRVTYRGALKNQNDAASITFTGQIDETVSGAEEASWKFLDNLANKDYKQAYAQLSPALKHSLSFGAFTKMYQNVGVDRRAVVICSQSLGEAEVLLAPNGSDVAPYQPAEVIIIAGQWLLNRLDPFTKRTADCKIP